MPPRIQPKTFILLLKTHKLTVLLTFPSTSTVADVKEEALSAFQSSVLENPEPNPEVMDADDNSEWVVPKVASVEDFELARALKVQGRPTGRYEKLEPSAQLKTVLSNWDPVFVQFKDPNGEWNAPTSTVVYIPSRSIRIVCVFAAVHLLERAIQEHFCPSRSLYRQSPRKNTRNPRRKRGSGKPRNELPPSCVGYLPRDAFDRRVLLCSVT
ncbi:hypothetical protein C8Q77DRAFT_436390 [Trametes polyzona]|nr:hypothetical protein C8Q77DRAFT_436390 [Trametes polyzona]